MTGVVIAAPHVFEPVDMPPWMQVFIVAMFGVIMMDAWADKIPGIGGINLVPQSLVLLSSATAVSTLLETDLIGGLSDRIGELYNSIAEGLSALFNIGGLIIAGIVLFVLAKKYMKSEKLLMDGMWFGIAAVSSATLFPWIAEALEWWLYAPITGLTNLFIIIVGGVGGWGITA